MTIPTRIDHSRRPISPKTTGDTPRDRESSERDAGGARGATRRDQRDHQSAGQRDRRLRLVRAPDVRRAAVRPVGSPLEPDDTNADGEAGTDAETDETASAVDEGSVEGAYTDGTGPDDAEPAVRACGPDADTAVSTSGSDVDSSGTARGTGEINSSGVTLAEATHPRATRSRPASLRIARAVRPIRWPRRTRRIPALETVALDRQSPRGRACERGDGDERGRRNRRTHRTGRGARTPACERPVGLRGSRTRAQGRTSLSRLRTDLGRRGIAYSEAVTHDLLGVVPAWLVPRVTAIVVDSIHSSNY